MTRADLVRAVKAIRAAETLADAIDVAIRLLVTPLQAQPAALPASEQENYEQGTDRAEAPAASAQNRTRGLPIRTGRPRCAQQASDEGEQGSGVVARAGDAPNQETSEVAALPASEGSPQDRRAAFKDIVGGAFDGARGCRYAPSHAPNLWCYWPGEQEPCAECEALRRAINRYADSLPHPAPSPDREIPLARLMATWRQEAVQDKLSKKDVYGNIMSMTGAVHTLDKCANELEAVLAASPDVSETMKTQDRTPPAPEDQP